MTYMRMLTMVAALLWPLAATASQEGGDPPERAAKERPPDSESWDFRWEEHPTLHFGKRARIELRARVQADVRGSEAPLGDGERFDLARRRVGVQGEVGRFVEFQVEGEINDGDPWRDVYVNYRQFPAAQVQAGKFKLPFSLDENTSGTNLDFVYRSRSATQLAPGRDRGVMVHGRVLERLVGYEAGIFAHDGDNARAGNRERVSGGRTTAGRLTIQPLRLGRSVFRDVQVGVAMTASAVPEGYPAIRGRTALDAEFFTSDLWVAGTMRRVGLELRWRPGPASVKAEYTRVSTARHGQSVADGDLSDLVATGWYVSSTYLLTGERKANGADPPRRPLGRGGFGALELAGRIERLAFGSGATEDVPSISPRSDAVFGNADRAATVGINWHPVRGVKLQANVVHEAIADASRGPLPVKSAFWSQLLRLQLTL